MSRIGLIDPVSIAVEMAVAQFLPGAINWITSAFEHPAHDAHNAIDSIKDSIKRMSAENRVAEILKITAKISPKAKGVEGESLFYWYRQNYPNDYMELTPDQKNAYNDYLQQAINVYAFNDSNALDWYSRSAFTQAEIDYNATPGSTLDNVLGSGTKKYIILGAIGLGLVLLFKK